MRQPAGEPAMSGNRLLRSTAIFSSMTFVSRLSGLVRDQVYAIVFGGNPVMDVFVAAFRIPNKPEAERLLTKEYRDGWRIAAVV